MGRRQFSREFKLEAVRLVKERGVSVVQASRDLDVGENILRRWIKELTADPGQAFPGQGQVKPEQQEIDRLRREVAKLKAERDILKRPRPTSRGSRCEVWLRREASRDLAGAVALRGARCLARWVPCLAFPVAQRSGTQRRGSRRRGQGQLCWQRPDRWRPAGMA